MKKYIFGFDAEHPENCARRLRAQGVDAVIIGDADNRTEENLPTETQKLVLGCYGKEEDFFTLRGVVERLLQHLGIATRVEARGESYLHPGRKAVLMAGDERVCCLGEVHPEVREKFDMPARAYIAELDMSQLARLKTAMGAVKPMPRYPAVTRDLSLVMTESTAVGTLMADMAAAAGKLLEDVKMFDVYRSAQLGADMKSVAFSFVFRGADHTLTDAEITAAMDKVLKVASEKHNANIRA